MIVQSEGIILKTTRYGETSLICQGFTRVYGLKSFIVKGVRTARSHSMKANIFQPGNIVTLDFYNTPHKSLQLVREAQLAYTYKALREDIPANCVQLFMLEVLHNILQQDFPQEELYDTVRHMFVRLDDGTTPLALLPAFFLLTINKLSGYTIDNNHSPQKPYLNIWEGRFLPVMPDVPPFLDATASGIIAAMNGIADMEALHTVDHRHRQHDILQGLLVFMEHHYPNFKPLRSLPVLTAILS